MQLLTHKRRIEIIAEDGVEEAYFENLGLKKDGDCIKLVKKKRYKSTGFAYPKYHKGEAEVYLETNV